MCIKYVYVYNRLYTCTVQKSVHCIVVLIVTNSNIKCTVFNAHVYTLLHMMHVYICIFNCSVQLCRCKYVNQVNNCNSISESEQPSTSVLSPPSTSLNQDTLLCCISSVFLLYLYFYHRILLHSCALAALMSIIRNLSRQSDIFTDFR